MPEFTKGKWEATTSAFGILYEALGDVCPEIAYLETTRLDETQRFYVNEIKKIVNKALALADGKEV